MPHIHRPIDVRCNVNSDAMPSRSNRFKKSGRQLIGLAPWVLIVLCFDIDARLGKFRHIFIAVVDFLGRFIQRFNSILQTQGTRIGSGGTKTCDTIMGHALILRDDHCIKNRALFWRFFGGVLDGFYDQAFHAFAVLFFDLLI